MMPRFSFIAVLSTALCPVMGLAQTNPMAAPFLETLEAAVADPAQKDALCAYFTASQGVGDAITEEPGAVTTRNPILREAEGDEAAVEQMAELGAAQSDQKMAAQAVSPEFATAVENLRIADPMAFLQWSVKLNRLCQ
jgi:hypothetical protein